jgi:hypothetical protein
VRLTAVLLQEDDATLQRRVCENDKTVRTYTTAAGWPGTAKAFERAIAKEVDPDGGDESSADVAA